MSAISCIIIGYLVGNINPAYIISRLKGFDIRDRGSGNAGASNAVIMLGKFLGIFCALFDIFKAYLAFKISRLMYPHLSVAGMLGGCACVVGHIFPVVMGFRGGKGLACLAGVAIGYGWKTFLALLAFEAVVALVTDYICMVSLTASVALPLIYWLQTGEIWGLLALLLVMAVMFYKHQDNLKRIFLGHEVHISYLWNKEAEIERLKDIFPEDCENAV